MIEQARNFIWHNARTLEQRWFEHAFDGGSAEHVVQAVLAYRNDDGGYGYALEPDHRGPTSQPLHALRALQLFGEVNAPEQAESVLNWLDRTCPDGSVTCRRRLSWSQVKPFTTAPVVSDSRFPLPSYAYAVATLGWGMFFVSLVSWLNVLF